MQHRFVPIFCRPIGSVVDILFRPNAVVGGLKERQKQCLASSCWTKVCVQRAKLCPPCVGQRSPTVQMTPLLFQLNNFHTPFPISSLPAGDSKCGCVPRPKQQQNARVRPLAHSVSVSRTLHRRNQRHIRYSVQIGFARMCQCPHRFCPKPVPCPNLFYLS